MIAIMGNWFPKKNRGFIVGMWATCNNFGNIAGIQLAAFLLLDVFDGEWQYLMVIAAAFSITIFFVVYFFLVPHPELVGIQVEEMVEQEALIAAAEDQDVFDSVIRGNADAPPEQVVEQVRRSMQFKRLSMASAGSLKPPEGSQVSFLKAWLLPRVMLYSSAFFCTKLAVYCLLLWLPMFLMQSELQYDDKEAANVSTVLDIGAMFGSVVLGYVSDLLYGKRSIVALFALIFSSLIAFTLTFEVYNMSQLSLMLLMFGLGFFVSGLNNMISAACSADLGKQEALKGNTKAISTVTGIIDGTGTLGSALGQFVVGLTQPAYGWQSGYLLIIAIDITVTVLPIMKIVYDEVRELLMIQKSAAAMGLSHTQESRQQ